MNGYSNSELREGRTHNARYYRIVINNGNIHIMTKYAYDCQTVDDGQNTMFYIWRSENLDKFYNTLSDLLEGDGISIPINNDIILTYRYNTLTCNTIVLRNEFLIFITKSEVEKYVKDYPDVKIV